MLKKLKMSYKERPFKSFKNEIGVIVHLSFTDDIPLKARQLMEWQFFYSSVPELTSLNNFIPYQWDCVKSARIYIFDNPIFCNWSQKLNEYYECLELFSDVGYSDYIDFDISDELKRKLLHHVVYNNKYNNMFIFERMF